MPMTKMEVFLIMYLIACSCIAMAFGHTLPGLALLAGAFVSTLIATFTNPPNQPEPDELDVFGNDKD